MGKVPFLFVDQVPLLPQADNQLPALFPEKLVVILTQTGDLLRGTAQNLNSPW